MNNLPIYTKADLRSAAGTTIFARVEEYYEGGMVSELVRRGDTLYATVEGSQYEPYQVTIHFTGSQIGTTNCTCPYGNWCKHVVAVLLTALAEPERMAERADLASLLAPLDRDQLSALLFELTTQDPALVTAIEAWLAQQKLAVLTSAATHTGTVTASHSAAVTTSSVSPLDAKTVRKDIRSALKGTSQVDAADQLLTQVQDLLNAGESRDAAC